MTPRLHAAFFVLIIGNSLMASSVLTARVVFDLAATGCTAGQALWQHAPGYALMLLPILLIAWSNPIGARLIRALKLILGSLTTLGVTGFAFSVGGLITLSTIFYGGVAVTGTGIILVGTGVGALTPTSTTALGSIPLDGVRRRFRVLIPPKGRSCFDHAVDELARDYVKSLKPDSNSSAAKRLMFRILYNAAVVLIWLQALAVFLNPIRRLF